MARRPRKSHENKAVTHEEPAPGLNGGGSPGVFW